MMNVFNKMVIVPEKEYDRLKIEKKQSNDPEPVSEQTDPKSAEEINNVVNNKKNVDHVNLDKIETSFRKAVKKYEAKLSKRSRKIPNKKEQCQTLKWTNVKNF